MTPERWQRIKVVLHEALEKPADQRSEFLARACAGNSDLRREVESFLVLGDVQARSTFLQSSASHNTLPCGTRLGEYEIRSLIGAGGMGEVYRAHDTHLKRDVAIKVLPRFVASDPERLRRFEQEAQATAALNHPNILAVYQMGTREGAPYLVSELLEGETLREQLKRGRIALRKAIDYAVQIARGLAAAHEKGIAHRDLKPENLFVTKDGHVKILDFGLAKLSQPQALSKHSAVTLGDRTEPGIVLGTVGYMAPEQVRGQAADHRSDIFSFGTVLYEMLTGTRAFQKPTSVETMTGILNDDPPSISQITPGLPAALQRAIHRCLEKSPEQRFQSASDLAFALETLSDSPSPTGPQSDPQSVGSLAVLPFENVGAQPELEYLSDGITEVLISSLARTPGLRVMARSTVFHFKGRTEDAVSIGKQLGVSSVVTGRILQRGNSIRIGVELVDVGDGWQLWGEQYRRSADELLFVEDEIPREIVNHLQQQLRTDRSKPAHKIRTTNLEAFHLYLKGRHHWNKRTEDALRKAISCFGKAIETDPVYALAYAGLADCYVPLGYWTFLAPQDAFPKAKAAAEKVLQLDQTIADAHAVLAGVSMCFEWRWQQAVADLTRAIQLNPHYPRAHQIYAEALTVMGDFSAAAAEAECAIELDPLAPVGYFAAAQVRYCARQYADALRQCEKALDIDPDFFPAHLMAGLVHEREGRFALAIESLEKACTASASNLLVRAVLSGTFAFAGRHDDARQMLRELERRSAEKYVSPIPIAITLAVLGESEAAFARLEDGLRLRCPRAIWGKVDPRSDILRSDRRFDDTLQRMGLQ